MFLVQDTSTPGSQCWLISGDCAVALSDDQSIQNFVKVGMPRLRMDPQAILDMATKLTPTD